MALAKALGKESMPIVVDSEDIYESTVIELLMENDELSYEEAGFMQGYNDF